MAGEFKYNEKTGMYEIVKDNKENNKAKEIGSNRDVQDPNNTLNENQQNSVEPNQGQQTSQQPNPSGYTEHKAETNEPRKTTNYTEEQMNTHRIKVETSKHTKTEQSNSNPHTQQSYNRNNSRLDSSHHQDNRRQSYNNQSNRSHNNNFNRPRNSFEELLENEQTMGMLAWVGTLIGMFVFNVSLVFIAIPIIFYVLYDKKSQFVRNHAREAINVCITSLIYSLVIVVGSFVMNAILFLIPPLAFMSMLFTVFGIIGVLAYTLIVGIQGAMAANKNEPYTPPFTFRFLKK